MKSKLFLFILLAVLAATAVLAETFTLEDTEERPAPMSTMAVKPTPYPTPAPTKAAVVKSTAAVVPAATVVKPTPAATLAVPSNDELKAKVDYIKTTLESAVAANNDLAADLREIQSDIRRIEERSLEIKGMSQDMTEYKDRLKLMEDSYLKDKETMDKALGELNMMKDNLKQSVDRTQSWGDIMDVLKKGISNNELEMAKMKKTINDLKLKYGDTEGNIFTDISKWPYLGFVTLLLSIIALSVAVAK